MTVAFAKSETPAIALHGLRKAYDGGRDVLAGLDLTIAPGERVALIGANGSGKSTLLRCLIGLHAVSGGTVEVLGETFQSLPTAAQRARLRRQAGFVSQRHGLVRRRSVLSNVVHGMFGAPGSWRAFAQAIAPQDWRLRGIAALDAVRLADRALDRADRLSGGQQQRVAIARALIREPRLLIADEPAASLDPAAGHEVMDLFSSLAKANGITLLFTSHDMEHARAYADRIVALRAGHILFDSPANAVEADQLAETFHA